MQIASPSQRGLRTRTPRILIVQWDLGMVRLLREMFWVNSSEVMIEQVTSRERARQRLACAPGLLPRLIVIGLGLHHQGGFDLLRHVRSTPALVAIPTIILAQSPELADERRALAIGADFYFEHPLDVDDFSPFVSRCRELISLDDHDAG